MKFFKKVSWGLGIFLALCMTQANASHFRGAAIVPSIDSQGVLTLEIDSFWRKGAAFSSDHVPGVLSITGGSSNFTQDSFVVDESDIRRTKATTVLTANLTGGAGNYSILWDGCCHQAGIPNSNSGWNISSEIMWDGVNAFQPIFFDLENIQQQVVIGSPYSDNLDATAGAGLTLSYNGNLNPDVTSQAPGLVVDPVTGELSIPAASLTNGSLYTTAGQGVAFAGNILANSATAGQQARIGFEWLFLDCDPQGQTPCAVAPQIQDVVVNALVGDIIGQTMLAVEDNGQLFQAPNLLTSGWDTLQSFNCSGGPAANAASWNPATQSFSWDSTGTAVGSCTASFRVTDAEGLTDTGSLVINLSNITRPPCGTPGAPPCAVPEPSTLPLLGLGLLGLASVIRRRKNQNLSS